VPEVSGLFVCSGWSGIGFKFAPPCANAAAKSIADFFSLGEKYRVNDEKIC
jgi:glycine/D-amino acid oxidase-like deaminating enzyme